VGQVPASLAIRFNLFNMASKLTKTEPIMNKDETVYFNHRTLRQLLGKHGWKVDEASYLYSLGVAYRESYRKKFLNVLCGENCGRCEKVLGVCPSIQP
jgi:hypothetical protein